jgi:mannose/fructose/N-acetylgalactosamine-specific phosphotransferase system component IIC
VSDASTIAVLALVAGALSLDTTAAFQVMVSQPLVAGSLAGLAVGEPALGAAVGATLQLVWIGSLPVGAAPFPDAAPASAVGVGLAFLLGRGGVAPTWSLAAGVIVGLAAGAIGRAVVGRLRGFNTRIADLALRRAERGDAGGVSAAVALGLATRFAAGFVVAATLLVAAAAVLGAILPDEAPGAFPTLLWAAPVGAAAIASVSRTRVERLFLVGGVAVGLVIVAVT